MLLGNILSHLPRGPKPAGDSWTRRTDGDMGSVADEDEYEEEDIREAISVLHQRTFRSYKNWATKMAGLNRATAFGEAQRSPDSVERKIHEIMLWWCVPAVTSRRRSRLALRSRRHLIARLVRGRCVWGEAGNMRFMPEFISFVFHEFVVRPHAQSLSARAGLHRRSPLPSPSGRRCRVHACRSSCRCRRRGGRRAGCVGTTWTR